MSTLIQTYFVALATDAEPVIEAVRWVRLFSLLPAWLYVYQLSTYTKEGSFCQRYIGPNRFLADVSVNCIMISLGFMLIGRSYVGSCEKGENEFNCNSEGDVNAVPQDSLYMLIISNIAVQALIKPRWQALFVSWVFGVASVIISSILAQATISPLLPFTLIMVLIILYEYERNVVRTYIALRNMESSIRTRMHAENEKRVMEMRSVEMRHLLGNVAHDLKTPMQSFVMELELVYKIVKRPASQTAEYVTYAVGDVRKMVESIQNLTDTNSFMYMVINRAIDYAKSSSGYALVPTLDTINVEETIQWAVDMVKSKARVPITLESLPASICSHIITDKQWLIENILCLVSNAAKFTVQGSVNVRCKLYGSSGLLTLSKPDMILIEVEDTGIGISEEGKTVLFQPYQQTMRMAGGTGLGLYSMSVRMRALGGECGVQDRSDGNAGCCFWFKIPYRPDASHPLQSTDALHVDHVEMTQVPTHRNDMQENATFLHPSSATQESVRENSPEILVVDDSLTIRKSISRVLCNEGFSVDLAENGQMALEMMGLKRYDLVLMDLQMPVMDGLEAVRRLRRQESDLGGVYHQKVIGISAYTGESYSSDALRAGMDAFIEKPFSAKRFFEFCEKNDLCLHHKISEASL